MGTESSWLKGTIENPVQLLKRLEAHDWDSERSNDTQRWRAGIDDWEEIQNGIFFVPDGKAIHEHYVAARNLANYGHE